MKKIVLAMMLSVCILSIAYAETYVFQTGAADVTSTSSKPITVTANNYDQVGALIYVDGGIVHWRVGADPTGSIGGGNPVSPGGAFVLDSQNDINNLYVILKSGESGASITYTVWGK